IRSQADVDKLAKEDWAGWINYQNTLQKAQNQQLRWQQAQQARALEQQQRYQAWAAEEDKKVQDRIPDLKDKEKSKERLDEAKDYMLNDRGYTEQEILWGLQNGPLRDARVQAAIFEAARRRSDAKKVQQKVAAKPVPKVQRPGSPTTQSDRQGAS